MSDKKTMQFNDAVKLLSELDDNAKGKGLDAAQWARALRIIRMAKREHLCFRAFAAKYDKRTR